MRVASVPSAHPYVAHLGVNVERLPDPRPPGAPPGRWWPPVALEPGWIERHADAFDLLHLHFGAEGRSPDELEGTVAALERVGRPLVHTIHDLVHPQLLDQARHLEHLELLATRADALITLTPGAAEDVRRRWGRRPAVIAHPHMVPLEVSRPLGAASRPLVLGLHLRDLRPNVDGVGSTRLLSEAVAHLRGQGREAVGRVELFDVVRDDAARDAIRSLCAEAGAHLALREGPRRTEAELLDSVADLDVSVLPYAWGTHSGWVELCWDLGVAVAAPAGVGAFAEQHPGDGSCAAFAPDGRALAAACVRLVDADGATRPGSPERERLVGDRRTARRAAAGPIADAHAAVYARVLAGGSTVTPPAAARTPPGAPRSSTRAPRSGGRRRA